MRKYKILMVHVSVDTREPLIKCHSRHCDREAQPWREAISNQVLSTC